MQFTANSTESSSLCSFEKEETILNLQNLTRTWLGSLPGLLLGNSAALQSFLMDISIIRILYVVRTSEQWQAAQQAEYSRMSKSDNGPNQIALLQDALSVTILVFNPKMNMIKLLSPDFLYCLNTVLFIS